MKEVAYRSFFKGILALLVVASAMKTTMKVDVFVLGAQAAPLEDLCEEDPVCDSGYRDKLAGNCCAFITDEEYAEISNPQESVNWDGCTGGVCCLIRWPPWKSNCFTGWVDFAMNCCYL